MTFLHEILMAIFWLLVMSLVFFVADTAFAEETTHITVVEQIPAEGSPSYEITRPGTLFCAITAFCYHEEERGPAKRRRGILAASG